ncbi:hypothetical protein BSG1_12511 [Bacillus sp. SG-1]|nr:hypothetical protein BSG1_12511 [Bacillus sp. SG-1]
MSFDFSPVGLIIKDPVVFQNILKGIFVEE